MITNLQTNCNYILRIMHKITFMNDTGSQLGSTAFILETNLTTEILINP